MVEFDAIDWNSSRSELRTSEIAKEHDLPWRAAPGWDRTSGTLGYGDYVQTKGRYLSMVWAPQWEKGLALMKIRYDGWGIPDKPNQRVCKLPASFTRYNEYVGVLAERGLGMALPWGEPAYLVAYDEVEGCLPRVPLNNRTLPGSRWM